MLIKKFASKCLNILKRGAFLLLPLISLLSFPIQYPSPVGFVNDFAGVIDEESKRKMEEIIKFVEEKTGAEMAVVTIKSLEGETVEEYANELFNKWGIGKKKEDNGVLILIAMKERKIRIEVGYGLEPILPDGLCGEIIRKDMTPLLREGKYGEALLRATQRVAEVITTKYKVALPEEYQPTPPINPNLVDSLFFFAVLFFLFFPLFFLIIGLFLAKTGLLTGIKIFLFFVIFGVFLTAFFVAIVIEPLSKGLQIEKGPLFILGIIYLGEVLFIFTLYRYPSLYAKSRRKGKSDKTTGFWSIFGSGDGGGFFGGGGFGGGEGFGGFGGGSSGGGGVSGSW